MNLGFTPEPPDAGEQLELVQACSIADGSFLANVAIGDETIVVPNARNVSMHGVRIAGRTLAGVALPGVGLTDSVLGRADVSAATWTDARLVRVVFEGCKLTGFDARGGALRDVVFQGCKLPDAFLNEAELVRVVLGGCQATNLDLSGATIESAAIRDCDARGLRLAGARIGRLDLRGSAIDGLVIEPGRVRHLVIDPVQAPALAAALGATVEHDA